MLKKLILLLLVIAPITAFAQDKIAYINSQEIFIKMPEMKDVESKLLVEREAIQKNAKAIEEEFETKKNQFANDPTTPTESVIIDRQTQLQQLQERYENFLQTSQANYEKLQQSLITPLQQKMMTAIKEVGDESGYAYILDRAALLYVNPSAADASAKVKTKLKITD